MKVAVLIVSTHFCCPFAKKKKKNLPPKKTHDAAPIRENGMTLVKANIPNDKESGNSKKDSVK